MSKNLQLSDKVISLLQNHNSSITAIFVICSIFVFGYLAGMTFESIFEPKPDCWISDNIVNGSKIFLEVHCN